MKIALAHVFRRRNSESLQRREVVMDMSMELRWFSPGTAEQVVDMALDGGLLTGEGESLSPSFEMDAVNVPLNFKPSPNIISLAEGMSSDDPAVAGIYMAIVDEIVKVTGDTRQEVIGRVNAKVMERGYTGEVAALLVGAEDDVDLKAFYRKVEEGLRKR